MKLKTALLAVAAAGGLLVAACGGGSADSGDANAGNGPGTTSAPATSGGTSSSSASTGVCKGAPTPAGTYLVAPQLFVADAATITVTVQAATPSVVDIFLFGASGSTVRSPSVFHPVAPTAGMQVQLTAVTPFQPGADITFGAGFRGDALGSEPLSFTALGKFPFGIIDAIANPAEERGLFFAENAGVMQTADGILVGFDLPGTPAPSTFDGFGVRISVSNVCVR